MRITYKTLKEYIDRYNEYSASYYPVVTLRAWNSNYYIYTSDGARICRGTTPRECLELFTAFNDGIRYTYENN